MKRRYQHEFIVLINSITTNSANLKSLRHQNELDFIKVEYFIFMQFSKPDFLYEDLESN